MLQQTVGADGLDEAEGGARSGGLNEHILIGHGGGHDEYGGLIRPKIQIATGADDADAVQLGEPDVNDGDIGMGALDLAYGVVAARGFLDVAVTGAVQGFPELGAAGGILVGDEYAGIVVFHRFCILL